jgi:hypothetical protein
VVLEREIPLIAERVTGRIRGRHRRWENDAESWGKGGEAVFVVQSLEAVIEQYVLPVRPGNGDLIWRSCTGEYS